MPIYNGSIKQKELYYGGSKIKEAYYGGTKVYDSIKPLFYCYTWQKQDTGTNYYYTKNEYLPRPPQGTTVYYKGIIAHGQASSSSELNKSSSSVDTSSFNRYKAGDLYT